MQKRICAIILLSITLVGCGKTEKIEAEKTEEAENTMVVEEEKPENTEETIKTEIEETTKILSQEEILALLEQNYGELYEKMMQESGCYYEEDWGVYLDKYNNEEIYTQHGYSSYENKREDYSDLIEEMENYISFLEQYPIDELEDKEKYDNYKECILYDSRMTHWMNHKKINEIEYPTIYGAYTNLAFYYIMIGDLEKCLSTRERLAEALGDTNILENNYTIEDTEVKLTIDQYGRTTSYNFEEGSIVEEYIYEKDHLIQYSKSDDILDRIEMFEYDETGRLIQNKIIWGYGSEENNIFNYTGTLQVSRTNGSKETIGEVEKYGRVIWQEE